jgi:4-hydroxybutyrate dehydrogenase/sulfolactaldehyde 3-reductase
VSELSTIGFIGLGTMGQSMARNLIKGGFAVGGFDIAEGAVAALAEAGGRAASSPREAAEGADLVIAMLPNTPHVEQALKGTDGIFAADAPGRLFLNSSTIDPGDARQLAGLCEGAGWRYLDCPVGRTADHAARGESLFMLGGAEADKAAVRPALEAMGDTIIDCGAVGMAGTIKITNNYLSIIASIATAEALRFAEAGGVDAQAALEIINQTMAMNGHTKINYPLKALAGDLKPGFAIDHAHKDLGIAVSAMARDGIPCFLGPGGLEAYDAARTRGHGANDWSDMYNVADEISKEGSG